MNQACRGQEACIEDLKRKDFIAVNGRTQKEACTPDFMEDFAKTCRSVTPLVKFLTRAVELPF